MTVRPTGPPSGGAVAAGRASWFPLVLLAAAQSMVALDVTVVNVALPSIEADLAFGPGDLQWVVSVYVLATGGLLLLGGRVADLFGNRRMFLAGLVLFLLASAGSGLARTSAVLVVSRALQGVAAAVMAPAALAVIARVYTGARRATALGVWGAIASGGAALGLLVGGALTTWLSWRWAFFINLPLGALVLAGAAWLPSPAADGDRRQLDVAGAVIGTAAFGLTLYGISEAAEDGWSSGRTLLLLTGGLVLLAAFAVVERHRERPLVPPDLWRRRSLAASTAGIFGATVMLVGALFLGAFLLTTTLRLTPVETGLALLPMAGAIAIAAHLAGALQAHLGARWASGLGLGISAAGAALLARVPEDAGYLVDVVGPLLLLGLGLGLSFVTFSVTSLAGIPPERAGSASGLYMTAHDIGGAFGVAVLSTAATAAAGGSAQALQTLAGQHRSFLVAALLTLGFAVLAATTMPDYRPPAGHANRSGHGHAPVATD